MRKTTINIFKNYLHNLYITSRSVLSYLVKLLLVMSLDKFFNHIENHNFNRLFENVLGDLYYLQTLQLYGNISEQSLAFTLPTGDTVYIFPYTQGTVENVVLNPNKDIILKINNIKISPKAKFTLKYKDRISIERISFQTRITYVFVELVIKLPIIFDGRVADNKQ